MGRRLLIAGNWKMNKGPGEADALARELKNALSECTHVDLAVAPTYLSIPEVSARLKHTGIQVGGQDLHTETSGALLRACGLSSICRARCGVSLGALRTVAAALRGPARHSGPPAACTVARATQAA